MARKQILKNFNGSAKTGLDKAKDQLLLGEVAVVHGDGLLAIKGSDDSQLHYFVNSAETSTAITQAETTLGGKLLDKVTGATVGNLALVGADGTIKDSGKKPSDFVEKNGTDRLIKNAEQAKLDAIVSGANKVEGSTINGNLLIDGAETVVYREPENTVHDTAYTHVNVSETAVTQGNVTLTKVSNASEVSINTIDGIDAGDVKKALEDLAGKISDGKLELGEQNDVLGLKEDMVLSSKVEMKVVNKHIMVYGKDETTVLGDIDTTPFLKDGMIDTVELDGDNLVITWNTDAGKKIKEISFAKFVDNYVHDDATVDYLRIDDTVLSANTSSTGLLTAKSAFEMLDEKADKTVEVAGHALSGNISGTELTASLVAADASKDGAFSNAQATKLAGVEERAEVNVLENIKLGTVTTAASEQKGAKLSEIDANKELTLDISNLTFDGGDWDAVQNINLDDNINYDTFDELFDGN